MIVKECIGYCLQMGGGGGGGRGVDRRGVWVELVVVGGRQMDYTLCRRRSQRRMWDHQEGNGNRGGGRGVVRRVYTAFTFFRTQTVSSKRLYLTGTCLVNTCLYSCVFELEPCSQLHNSLTYIVCVCVWCMCACVWCVCLCLHILSADSLHVIQQDSSVS